MSDKSVIFIGKKGRFWLNIDGQRDLDDFLFLKDKGRPDFIDYLVERRKTIIKKGGSSRDLVISEEFNRFYNNKIKKAFSEAGYVFTK